MCGAMIFLSEIDIQKKRSEQNDDREGYWLEYQARSSSWGRRDEVRTRSLNLLMSWLSRGCGS